MAIYVSPHMCGLLRQIFHFHLEGHLMSAFNPTFHSPVQDKKGHARLFFGTWPCEFSGAFPENVWSCDYCFILEKIMSFDAFRERRGWQRSIPASYQDASFTTSRVIIQSTVNGGQAWLSLPYPPVYRIQLQRFSRAISRAASSASSAASACVSSIALRCRKMAYCSRT